MSSSACLTRPDGNRLPAGRSRPAQPRSLRAALADFAHDLIDPVAQELILRHHDMQAIMHFAFPRDDRSIQSPQLLEYRDGPGPPQQIAVIVGKW